MRDFITCLLISILFLSGCTKSIQVTKEVDEQAKSLIDLQQKKDIPASFFPDPIQVVSVGDSLTQGVGDSTDTGGYLPYLQKKLEKEPSIKSVEMRNYGVKGNRTDQLLERLNKEEIRADLKTADSIVVTIGGNDIMQVFKQNFTHLEMEQFSAAKIGYESRLREIFKKIRSYNKTAQIYLVGVYNPFAKWGSDFYELEFIIQDWNNSGEKIAAEYDNSYFIEIEDIFKSSFEDLLYTEDYFHPNDRGYELIATRIYNNMEIMSLGDDE